MRFDIRRVLFVTHSCYLDSSNGAAVASRAMMEALARWGWPVEVLCGSVLESRREEELADWLAARGWTCEEPGGAWTVDARGVRADGPTHWRLVVGGVPVTIHQGPTTRPHLPDQDEAGEFLRLLDAAMERFRPEVLVGYGGDRLSRTVFARARARGLATVFALHNFQYDRPEPFEDIDAVIVPSRFAAVYYREAIGLDCNVLPNLIDPARARVEDREPKYLTFVNPSTEKGVFAFARIADELGRQRPEIPILVVEGRGDEATVASCGLDLRERGNVFFMAHTPDPRRFWRLTRLCLLPSLWWENQPLVAIEAMANGIPVIGSDRGGIPEVLGRSGTVLPLPDWLTPSVRKTPTPLEVAPWVDAIIRLWDDPALLDEHRRRALAESRRWALEAVEPRYARFFHELRPGTRAINAEPTRLTKAVALVPYRHAIPEACESALRSLEKAGIRVIRRRIGPDLNRARAILASDALHDGAERLLFLDPDFGFDPIDARRLLARPEPVIVGISNVGGSLDEDVRFAAGVEGVRRGSGATGLYPLEHAGAGFLRVRADVLRRLIVECDLPLCDTDRGRGAWPFFQPMIVPGEGGFHALTAVEAFYQRLRQIGITPLADPTIRLTPLGMASPWSRAAVSWEQVPGMFDFQAVYDEAVARATDGAVFVEVGCLAGRSTCYLGTRVRESGKAITLYAIDTGRGSATDSTGQMIAPGVGGTLAGILHRNLNGCGLDQIVVPILTESTRAAKLFPPESVDFGFIDGDHRYESVLADLRAWWPTIKPGGVLAGHDYRQSADWLLGVTPAVHDFFGVADASHPTVPSCWWSRKSARGIQGQNAMPDTLRNVPAASLGPGPENS